MLSKPSEDTSEWTAPAIRNVASPAAQLQGTEIENGVCGVWTGEQTDLRRMAEQKIAQLHSGCLAEDGMSLLAELHDRLAQDVRLSSSLPSGTATFADHSGRDFAAFLSVQHAALLAKKPVPFWQPACCHRGIVLGKASEGKTQALRQGW